MESKPRRIPGRALAKSTRRIGTSKEDKASACAPPVQAFISGDQCGELRAAVRKLSAVWQRLGEARRIRTLRTLKQLMAGLPDHRHHRSRVASSSAVFYGRGYASEKRFIPSGPRNSRYGIAGKQQANALIEPDRGRFKFRAMARALRYFLG